MEWRHRISWRRATRPLRCVLASPCSSSPTVSPGDVLRPARRSLTALGSRRSSACAPTVSRTSAHCRRPLTQRSGRLSHGRCDRRRCSALPRLPTRAAAAWRQATTEPPAGARRGDGSDTHCPGRARSVWNPASWPVPSGGDRAWRSQSEGGRRGRSRCGARMAVICCRGRGSDMTSGRALPRRHLDPQVDATTVVL